MKIRLFRAFPDPYRQSMTIYADQLLKGLRQIGKTAEDFIPKPLFLKPPLRYFSQYIHYPAAAAFHQSDVNHITDHVYSHLVCALDPKRTVITFHDAIWLKYRKNASGLTQKMNLSGLRKAAAVICDSEASKRGLLEYVSKPEGRVEVIFPGLDPVFKNTQGRPERAPLGLAEGTVYLLYVGHTASYKNIDGVLKTFALVRHKIKNAKLIRVGTAFTSEQTALAQKLGVQNDILFKNSLSKAQLVQIYRVSDFLLFPSYDEGFGFPALEAMASDLPVIASDRGSLPEVVASGGVLRKPDDHEGMAEAILELWNQPEKRRALIEKGRKRAADFDWNLTAKQFLEVYEQVRRA
jgi:glycosyltransferase involved in cell wall biosynthesis